MHEKRGKIFSILVMLTLVIAVVTTVPFIGPIVNADPGDQPDSYYNETTLNVTVLQLQPRILWYDLQNAAQVSMKNDQIDVNEYYYFKVNISSDQGWADIEYIWINAWADLGTDPGSYNNTAGGNINLNITYDNSTETASVFMPWPTNGSEATFNGWSEENKTGSDPSHSPGNTETYNLTFNWTPSYQFRYTPDPTDDNPGHNDTWSWNFNITVLDEAGNYSYNNPTVGETIDEFGVYSYTEITSVGWPWIVGNPGQNVSVNDGGSNNITINARSNGNYSTDVDIDQLNHSGGGDYANISKELVWTRGGDLNTFSNFTGTPIYFYSQWHAAENDNTSFDTDDIEYKVDIPLAQLPGNYNATIYYHLATQTG